MCSELLQLWTELVVAVFDTPSKSLLFSQLSELICVKKRSVGLSNVEVTRYTD